MEGRYLKFSWGVEVGSGGGRASEEARVPWRDSWSGMREVQGVVSLGGGL